jgi:hypothetical protein
MVLDDGRSVTARLGPSSRTSWLQLVGDVPAPSDHRGREPAAPRHADLEKEDRDPRRGTAESDGSGGPDEFGYRWIDSDEPEGPTFVWEDITAVGHQLYLGDDTFVEIELPFIFPFYSANHGVMKICSNGYLTFGDIGSEWQNQPIPDPTEPNDLIAAFWDDLDPSLGGLVHHYYDGERLIVQYTEVPRHFGVGVYTFQMILYPNGTMLFQYLDMQGELTSATVGIEDPPGGTGLEVVFNAAYVHDNLAVLIQDPVPWLWESPPNGVVDGGGSQAVDIWVDPAGLPPGSYGGSLLVHSNDPAQPEVSVPVSLVVHEATGVRGPAAVPPLAYKLHLSAPNPFRSSTTIRYEVPGSVEARLDVYDVSGRLVRMLLHGDPVQPGLHQVTWDGRDEEGRRVATGVYFYRLRAGSFTRTGRMVVIK